MRRQGVFSRFPRLLVSLSPCLFLLAASSTFGQAPQGTPSADDGGRIPMFGGASGQGAMIRQGPIGGFPTQQVAPNVMNQYRPPRPGLSPYLNLFRGTGGVGAVDFYNFVRPAQQSLGSFEGRQPGPFNPGARFGNFTFVDPELQLPADAVTHSAGSAGTFMNTGQFFNSMGTIGTGNVVQQQRPPIRIGGR